MDETHTPGDEYKNNTYKAAHDCRIVKRFAYSHITIISHGYENHHLTASEKMNKKIWARQASKEIVLHSTKKSAIILGVAKEATHISIKERFASRKHIGV